jgi:hypothetical protein
MAWGKNRGQERIAAMTGLQNNTWPREQPLFGRDLVY